jgi:hypothetical protein
MWRKAHPPSAALFAGTQQVAEEWVEVHARWLGAAQLKPGGCSDGAQSVLRRVGQILHRLLPERPPVCRSLSMQPTSLARLCASCVSYRDHACKRCEHSWQTNAQSS